MTQNPTPAKGCQDQFLIKNFFRQDFIHGANIFTATTFSAPSDKSFCVGK